MKLNIDHLINCYEEMIRDNPKEAATYEVGAISAELVLYGLKQQRDYINELETKLKENNK